MVFPMVPLIENMTKEDKLQLLALDDAAEEAGGYVDHTSRARIGSVHYDYRAIMHYCRENGIQPIDDDMRNAAVRHCLTLGIRPFKAYPFFLSCLR